MSAATLTDVRAAIHAALAPLKASEGGPFLVVDDWAGELSNAQDNLSAAVLNQSPAALVAFAGERPVGEPFQALGGASEGVDGSVWTVIVVAKDTRRVGAALATPAGAGGVGGVLALADRVKAALNALPVAGLYRTTRLRFADLRWYAVARGQLYALAVQFVARRVGARAVVAPTGAPLEEIHGDENTTDGGAVDGNPVAQFVADTAT